MMHKCPVCGAVAKVDKDKKTVTVEYPPHNIPKDQTPSHFSKPSAFKLPSHSDCEFTKTVDEIDLDNLEEVEHVFKIEVM